MNSCGRVRAVACAVGAVVGLWQAGASAEEQAAARRAEPPAEHVRLDLGLGLLAPTNSGSGGGGVGALGITTVMPFTRATFEAHLAGPAWFLIAAQGGYEESSFNGDEGHHWLAALRIGPRFEARVIDEVEAGGYVLVEGALGHVEVEGYGASNLQVGGVAGGSIHFRPTPLFGVRLAIDVLRAGYQRGVAGEVDASTGYVRLTASPSIELTFTF